MKYHKVFLTLLILLLGGCEKSEVSTQEAKVTKPSYEEKTDDKSNTYDHYLIGEGDNWIVKIHIDGNLVLNNPLYPDEYLFDTKQVVNLEYKGFTADLGEKVAYNYKNKVWDSPVYTTSKGGFAENKFTFDNGNSGLIKEKNVTKIFPIIEEDNKISISWKDKRETVSLTLSDKNNMITKDHSEN